jgi:hypothetical protein
MATGTDSQATTPFPGRIDRRLSLVFAVLFVLVHLKSILAKLHLDNRVQAATLALRQGLVPPRPPAP